MNKGTILLTTFAYSQNHLYYSMMLLKKKRQRRLLKKAYSPCRKRRWCLMASRGDLAPPKDVFSGLPLSGFRALIELRRLILESCGGLFSGLLLSGFRALIELKRLILEFSGDLFSGELSGLRALIELKRLILESSGLFSEAGCRFLMASIRPALGSTGALLAG